MSVVLDLSVTISDADYPRLMAAARSAFTDIPKEAPDSVIIEALRQNGMMQMKGLVRAYERAIAIKAAESLDPKIEVS